MRFYALFLICFLYIGVTNEAKKLDEVPVNSYAYWKNATVPFYVNQSHFDREQTATIMTTLSMFAFKTCIKFLPVLVPPARDNHVLVLQNPKALKNCEPAVDGHPPNQPHVVTLGYECLSSPYLEMMVMKALGLPYEHTRQLRVKYITVLMENVEAGKQELFTISPLLPKELRALPYDINSVMHFGERDFSKNGHKTFIIKYPYMKQERRSLTDWDVKKLGIIYGPECRNRDRQEKVEICQNYPTQRKKRSLDSNKSLRVNPDITPPASNVSSNSESSNLSSHTAEVLKELNVENEVQSLIDGVYNIVATALDKARGKYCNETSSILRSGDDKNKPDILGIVDSVTDYVKSMVDKAMTNVPVFCEVSQSINAYQRSGYHCSLMYDHDHCQQTYYSTKTGNIYYSTQKKLYPRYSTNHRGGLFLRHHLESSTVVEATEKMASRRKRSDANANNTNASNAVEKTNTGYETGSNKSDVMRRTNTRDNFNSQKLALRAGDYENTPSERKRKHTIDDTTEGDNDADSKPSKRKKKRSDKPQDVKADHKQNKNKNKLKVRSKSRSKKDKERQSDQRDEKGNDDNAKTYAKDLPKTINITKTNRDFYNDRKWTEGRVYYVIEPLTTFDLDDLRSRLAEVAAILEKKTCVRLTEVTQEEADRDHTDYLVIDSSPDYVTGRVGGKQHFGSIELFEGGQHRQHAAMMVMAMLGFYFEVGRLDRDDHIVVHNRHIRPDKLHHFEKIREGMTLPLPYDYYSATHPAWQFWRKIGKKGISTVATFKNKDPDGSLMKKLGQNERLLSKLDIVKINTIYGVDCFDKTKSRRRVGHVAK